MKRFISVLLFFCALHAWAVVGDITAVRISGQTQRTVADGNITNATTTLTSATAAFTSSDVGRNVIVRGAGAAGADLNTRITVVTNATTVTVGNAAGTTVTNASTVIGYECNGTCAEIDISGLAAGGSYNTTGFGIGLTGLSNAGVTPLGTITCTVPTYVNAIAGTMSLTVDMTQPVRRPYPNNLSMDEFVNGGTLTIRVWLSAPIFPDDTGCKANVGSGLYTQGSPNNAVVNLAVTNNSTLSYGDTFSIWRWAQPPAQQVTADFKPELVAFNQFGQNGEPLDSVNFSCTDGANTATALVNKMTVSTWEADPNKVLVYSPTIPITGFTQGATVTCNATMYPYRGNTTTSTATGITVGDERPTPTTYLIDKTGAYGQPAAIVDPVNGHNSNAVTWVAANVATAEANYQSNNTNSYNTGSNAMEACRTFNNANNGHNDAAGCHIRFVNGNHAWPGADSAAGCMSKDTQALTWTYVEPYTGASPAFTTATRCGYPGPLKIEYTGFNMATGGAISTFGEQGSSASLWEWFNGNTMNMNNTAWDYGHLQGYATLNTVTALDNNGFGIHFAKSPFALVRGNTVTTAGNGSQWGYDYAFLGNKNMTATTVDGRINFQGAQNSDRQIVAFNSGFNLQNNADHTIFDSVTVTQTGAAYVQNLWEEQVGTVGPMSFCSDGSSNTFCKNIIVWNNTIVGERTNIAYDENSSACTVSYLRTLWSFKFNISSNLNIAGTDTDTTHGCAADGARTGNWPVLNMVGSAGNVDKAWSASANYFAPEFLGPYATSTATLGFVNDQSQNVGGTGNGNYHLTAGSALINVIPKAQCVIPYDLDGKVRCASANGSVGAYAFSNEGGIVPVISGGFWQ